MATGFDNRLGQLDTLNQFGQVGTVVMQAGGVRAPKRPMMAPSTPDNYALVGRDASIADIRAALLAGAPRAIAIELAMGIGKTALACLLANDDALQEHYADGILWANLGKAPDVRHELRRWAHELLHPDELAAAAADGDEGSQAYWQRVVEKALVNRRALLVIDDVWVADNGRAFKLGGNDCAYIFTTRFTPIANELSGKVVSLPPLNVDQGIALLDQFAPKAVLADAAAARALVARVDGLPQALIPIACYLRQASGTGQARRIRDAMTRLDDADMLFSLEHPPEYGASLPRSLRGVIEASYRWLGSGECAADGDHLRAAVESLAILRPNPSMFCEDLAARVAHATPQTLDALCEAGLIEARGDHFTMHRTFAEYLRGKLSAEKRRELHLRATAFYREELNALEEEYQKRESSYRQWYRYEDDTWGDTMDEWLYHLGRAGEYETVIIAFLRAWFDGFWWWGCFLDFKFCDQLLREWQQRDIRPQSREGLLLLTRFKDAYPKETEARQSGDWQQVQTTLTALRQQTGIADDVTALTADGRHLRALTSIFVAEAHRFGAKDHVAAELFYRDALQLFEAEHDDWDTAWTCYHLADMLVGIQRFDDATALCHKALALAEREQDPEIQANLHRLTGDLAICVNRYADAAHAYHRATQEAYRFQIEPELPDAYTIRFYAQMTQQIGERIVHLNAAAPTAAMALAVKLRDSWQSYWGQQPAVGLNTHLCANDPVALAEHIFPATLPADSLTARGKQYATEVSRHLAELEAPG